MVNSNKSVSLKSLFNNDGSSLNLLHWQSNEDLPSTKRCKKPPNHIRLNIIRLKQLQDEIAKKQVLLKEKEQFSKNQYFRSNSAFNLLRSNSSSNTKSVSKCTQSNVVREFFESHKPSSAHVSNSNSAKNKYNYCNGQADPDLYSNDQLQDMSRRRSRSSKPVNKSCQTHSISNNQSMVSSRLSSSNFNLSDQKPRSYVKSMSDRSSKQDYLKAHSRNIDDPLELCVLGNIPIAPLAKPLSATRSMVPQARDAKYVHLVRRDINFVRANAHLASLPKKDSACRIRHASSLNSIRSAIDSESIDVDLISNSATSNSQMWPERKLQAGKVPAYLIKQKKREKEAADRLKMLQPDPDTPPGHQLMSDKERLDTLELLKKAQSDLSDELSHMPVRSDTLRIRNRKNEIESRLAELDRAVHIFSRPKVFVRL